jgi:hypothetical protein
LSVLCSSRRRRWWWLRWWWWRRRRSGSSRKEECEEGHATATQSQPCSPIIYSQILVFNSFTKFKKVKQLVTTLSAAEKHNQSYQTLEWLFAIKHTTE